MKWSASLGFLFILGGTTAGCAHVPPLPGGMPGCSPGVMRLTHQLALPRNQDIPASVTKVTEGLIELLVTADVHALPSFSLRPDPQCRPPAQHRGLWLAPVECTQPVAVPAGTRMLGEAEIRGRRLQARVDRAVLPTGAVLSLCGYLIHGDQPGMPLDPPAYLERIGGERPEGAIILANDNLLRIRPVGQGTAVTTVP